MIQYPIQRWIDLAVQGDLTFTLTKHIDYQALKHVRGAILSYVNYRNEYHITTKKIRMTPDERGGMFEPEKLKVTLTPTYKTFKTHPRTTHPYKNWYSLAVKKPHFLHYLYDYDVSSLILQKRLHQWAIAQNLYLATAKSPDPAIPGIWVMFSDLEDPEPFTLPIPQPPDRPTHQPPVPEVIKTITHPKRNKPIPQDDSKPLPSESYERQAPEATQDWQKKGFE